MADFFSRIFAIPSDVSSNYSVEELRAADGANNAGGGGRKKRGHRRTLTPLSLTDGNGTATSASFGEGTLSRGSDSAGTGSNSGASEQPSSTSTSTATETMEEHLHLGPMDLHHRHGEVEESNRPRTEQRAPASADKGLDRGRQRRDDAAVHRSASEPRRRVKKAHRSSSMATSRNMKLQLKSPEKRNRRHKTIGKIGSMSATSSHKDPTLTRVNSWSSGDEKEGERRRRRSSSRASSARKKKDKKDKGTPTSSQQKTAGEDTLDSSTNSRKRPTKAKKKDKRDRSWRSKLAGGVKKHLSPGSGSPPQEQQKTDKSNHAKTKKKHKNSPPKFPLNDKSGDHRKQSSSPGANLSPQPINVGDSIFISQQFLQEGMEMSILTIPRELNEDQAVAMEFDKTIQQVGQRGVMENAHVQRFYARHQRDEDNAHRGEIVPSSFTGTSSNRFAMSQKISQYASRVLEEGNIYQSYSQDDQDDEGDQQLIVHDGGIEVLPPVGGGGKHSWPCDPSAEGYSPPPPTGDVPPPPPPPPPTTLPPRHNGRSPRNNAAATASNAVPHWNTPVDSNSESIATSYNDPPGTLVTSPTLQYSNSDPSTTLQYSSSDPSPTLQYLNSDPSATLQYSSSDHSEDGEDLLRCRPFDEESGFCGNNKNDDDGMQQHPTTPTPGNALTQGALHNKQGSDTKAVTFSLPPPSLSNPPAPPFMGPSLDYYYSMEPNPDDKDPWMSSSPLLPPIIELWASVESADNIPGDIGEDVTTWDAERENALLGEDLPLYVSEEWIDVADKEEDLSHDALNTAQDVPEEANHNIAHHQKESLVKMSSSTTTSTWEDGKHYVMEDTPNDEFFDAILKHEDTPHDEYFDDILNCQADFAKVNVNNDNDDDQADQQQSNDPDAANLATILSSDLDDDNVTEVSFRHRSTWNTGYKPPTLSSTEDYSYLPDGSDHDDWQRLLRHRANAATTIQKWARGMLERQRMCLLMDSGFVIQACIRRYLSRKRFVEYLKVKSSYFPRRWERSHMAVAI